MSRLTYLVAVLMLQLPGPPGPPGPMVSVVFNNQQVILRNL